MKKSSRVLIGAACVILLAVSWLLVFTSKSDAKKQAELIDEATALMADDIYIRAQPLLEEAAGYNGPRREEAESELKAVYAKLIDDSGVKAKLTDLIERQISRKDASAAVYKEAAEYYQQMSKPTQAIAALRKGVENTGDEELKALYEKNRYIYDYSGETYEDATAVYNDMIQVKVLGKWGIANQSGELMIPCEYDKISTFSDNKAVVKKGGEMYSIDASNHRVYLLHEKYADFGNYGNGILSLKTAKGWIRADGSFALGSTEFEELGMYSNGYAAAKTGGKWGVIDAKEKWKIEPIYDGIIMDELGRCWAQNAVFAKTGGKAILIVDGKQMSDTYDDALPFTAEGYAAVKKGDKWGFVDTKGNLVIDYKFDNAKSFGQHLAAVQVDDRWGYISLDGTLVIHPEFRAAGYFSKGAAPVQTDDGWQFIILQEYEEGSGSGIL